MITVVALDMAGTTVLDRTALEASPHTHILDSVTELANLV